MRRRRWLRTTPGRLRTFSILAVVAIVLLWLVTASALNTRRDAARSVATSSGPRLVATEDLYRALADADATASSALLRAGLEPPADRQRYLDDLARAGRLLTRITKESGSSSRAEAAAATIAQQLPVYAGRVEAARTNIRFGFPVGAEYMRQASGLMREEILPAATALYAAGATQLDHDYESGTSGSQIAWTAVVGVLTLALLAAALVFTARRTNRILNVGLVAASVVVALVLVWSIVRFDADQRALVSAQRKGSDAVQVLSTARILGLQAQADANLELAERGTGATYHDAWATTMARLGGAGCAVTTDSNATTECAGGSLERAATIADRAGDRAQVNELAGLATDYVANYAAVRNRDDSGDYAGAVKKALGEQADAAAKFDNATEQAIQQAQARFDTAASDARVGFGLLAVALTAGLLLAAVLAIVGLQRRIGEYR